MHLRSFSSLYAFSLKVLSFALLLAATDLSAQTQQRSDTQPTEVDVLPFQLNPQSPPQQTLPAPQAAPQISTQTPLTQILPNQAPSNQIPPNQARPPSIETETLGTVLPVDAGLLTPESGGLVKSMWTGTPAVRATRLLDAVPAKLSHPVARDLVRAVLLSESITPQSSQPSDAQAYRNARVRALIRVGEMQTLNALVGKSQSLARDPVLQANMALVAGDGSEACATSDSRDTDRSDPYWVKLRAFCHIKRDEIPAAELLSDVLRNNGHEDDLFFDLLARLAGSPQNVVIPKDGLTPLHVAMVTEANLSWPEGAQPHVAAARDAFNRNLSPEARLEALYAAGPALSERQMDGILRELADTGTDPTAALAGGGATTLSEAADLPVAARMGQYYLLAQTASPTERLTALSAFLQEADEQGALYRMVQLMTPALQRIAPAQQAQSGQDILAHAALLRRDQAAVRTFAAEFQGPQARRARLALASNAIGFGFLGADIGPDVIKQLQSKDLIMRQRAMRDTMLAIALGASLSEPALAALDTAPVQQSSVDIADLAALRHAARNGAQAETALRVAMLLEQTPLETHTVFLGVDALQTVGLSPYASQIAALDYWDGTQ